MSLSNSNNVKRKVRVGICSQLIDGRYLNVADTNFLEIVLEDVQGFQDKGVQSSVLVFPPFNNYHRFLIHKFIEDNFEDLSTFSVGQSSGRRTVVCYKEQLLRQEIVSKRICVATTVSMGVQQQTNSNQDQDAKVIITCSERKKVRTLPDVAIYRPPALRRVDEGPSASTLNEKKPKASKQRRPDIAVYVPRALRGAQKTNVTPKSPTTSGLILKHLPISACESEVYSEEKILSPQPSKANASKKISHSCIQTSPQKLSSNESLPSPAAPNSQSEILKDSLLPSTLSPDSLFDDKVMHHSPISTSSSSSSFTSRVEFSTVATREIECPRIGSSSSISDKQNGKHTKSLTVTHAQCFTSKNDLKGLNVSVVDGNTKSEHVCSEEMAKDVAFEEQLFGANKVCIGEDERVVEDNQLEKSVQIKDNIICSTGSSPEKNVEKSGEIGVINVRKTNAFLDGEIRSQSKEKHCVNILKDLGHRHEVSPKTCCFNSKNLDEAENGRTVVCENDSEEDSVPLSSWEELFDLSEEGIEVAKAGDNKTQKLMEEVITAVGKVNVLEKARCNYTQYRTDNAHALAELSHVVEVYGFPSEFKTQDLISVLSPYGGGNSCAPAFEIKWVDDTHALAVFASSFVAADVLNLHHPMVKTRPLEEASAVSKAKARKTCESLRIPFRPRPETCAALAQRLITGALGVHHRQSKAEREEERRLLREAREKRRNAAKERDAAWEGTIASSL